MIKKITSSLIIMLVVGGVLFYLYNSGFKQDSADTGKVLGITQMSPKNIVGPMATSQASAVWYGDTDGRLYRTDVSSGQYSQYPTPAYAHKPLSDIIWPKSGADFIMQGRGTDEFAFTYYNSLTKTFVELPPNVTALDWMPDSRRIALIWKRGDGTGGDLVISNADNTGYQTITALPWTDMLIRVSPNGKQALLVRNFALDPINKVYLFDLETGAYQTKVEDGHSNNAMWLDETRFLYFQKTGNVYPKVFMHDLETGISRYVGIEATPHRLSFDDSRNVLYAAVIGLNDFDEIVSINLESLDSDSYFVPEEQITMRRLLYSLGKVFIVRADDGVLYQVK